MTQAHPNAAMPAKVSAWSIVSLVLAIGFCPLVTIAAIPAGLMALRDVRVHGRRGRRLAIVAMVLAGVVTPLTSVAMWWWDGHVRQPLVQGPLEPLQAGQHGDAGAFLAGLGHASTAADRRSANVFLKDLNQSLGIIQSMRVADAVDPASTPAAEDEAGVGWFIWVPYDAMFQNGAARLHARFLLSTPTQGWVTHFDVISVEVNADHTLTWPPNHEVPDVQ